jgi:hypothetical protein
MWCLSRLSMRFPSVQWFPRHYIQPVHSQSTLYNPLITVHRVGRLVCLRVGEICRHKLPKADFLVVMSRSCPPFDRRVPVGQIRFPRRTFLGLLNTRRVGPAGLSSGGWAWQGRRGCLASRPSWVREPVHTVRVSVFLLHSVYAPGVCPVVPGGDQTGAAGDLESG